MAINMSYGLLTSKTNNYKIPEYNSGYVNNTFSESQILQLISDFNQELREATFSLNLINYDTEYLNEASVLVNIRETIKTIVDRIITAITTLVGRIIDALKHVYEILTKKKEIVYVDRIVKEYRVHDRMSLLAKALKDLPVQQLEVASIVPTAELVTKGFPNTNAIGKNLVSMIGSSVKSYVSNYKVKNGTSDFDIEAEASEGLASFVQFEKKRILDAIFGKYEYDSTNIMESAKGAAIKAFGNTEPYKQILTVALYSQACDNIENQDKEAIDSIKFELKSVEENYSKTLKSLEQLKKDFIKLTSNYTVNNYGDPVKTHNDIRTSFANATDIVVRNLNTIINAINQSINANIVIIAHKIKRIEQVYSATGDANKVRQYAHRLINNSLGTSDQGVNEAYSVEPEEDEFINEQEIFDRQLVMLEECWMEHEFNSYIEQVILEADDANGGNAQQGNATQAAATTQTTTDTTTQQTQQQNTNNAQQKTTTSKPNDNNSVIRLINKIIENMVTMYEKFKNRVDTLIIKTDSSFWNVNRAKIRALDLSKCTVNDWYSYDFGVLKKSVVLNNGNFDINSPDLVSDDALQNAILNNINPTKPSVEKDTDPFTTKLANRYYTNYIPKDANEVALGSMGSKGYNHQQAFTFVDNMVRNGFNDEYLKSIDNDTKTLKKIQETIKQNKPVLTDQADDAKADAKAATTTGTPQNAAAIMTGKFNLAEMFALPQKKYSGELPFININEDVTVPDELQQGSDVIKDGAKDRNRATNETDVRINRYFRYTSMAVTSRMTVLIKAYKQYMELYKAVFNPSKKNTPDNKNQKNDNNQNNQQQQQTNNQNQSNNQENK